MAELKDNRKEYLDALTKQVNIALNVIGGKAATYAKENITNYAWEHQTENNKGEAFHRAIDTGLLRNSITYAIDGEPAAIAKYHADRGGKSGTYSGTMPKSDKPTVYIGTNVEYRQYIELGTSKIPAVRFLTNAAAGHTAEYERVVEKALKG